MSKSPTSGWQVHFVLTVHTLVDSQYGGGDMILQRQVFVFARRIPGKGKEYIDFTSFLLLVCPFLNSPVFGRNALHITSGQ